MAAQRLFVVMPVEGWRSDRMLDLTDGRPLREIAERAQTMAAAASATPRKATLAPETAGGVDYDILAHSHEDGPKLIAMTADSARRLARSTPDVMVEPSTLVRAAVRSVARVAADPRWARAATAGGNGRRVQVRVEDDRGRPVAGARIIALSDVARRTGVSRRTRETGRASFIAPAGLERLPRVLIQPPPGFAGRVLTDVEAAGEIRVSLIELDPAAHIDALRRWLPPADPTLGAGVRIGVADTGVDPGHPDLAHVRDFTVHDDQPGDDLIPAHWHGAHVAGIIGGRGPVFRSLAPAAEIVSCRVTPRGKDVVTAFFLGDGIEKLARQNDLHLINISMAQNRPSGFLAKAAAVAYRAGAVCIAAAGNDGRDLISHPAASKRVIAVTAFGEKAVLDPDGPDMDDLGAVESRTSAGLHRAAFSNWGPETDFIAPGVAILSCRAGGGYAAQSGTSFAAPAITGLAAVLLSRHHPHVLAMPKGPARAAAITQALLTRSRDLGFAFETQGNGILDV